MLLPNLCDIQMGYTLRERMEPVTSGGTLAIQLGNISSEGGVEASSLRRYAVADVPDRYLVRAGDVLFRSRGEKNTAVALDDRLKEPALPLSPLIVLRPIRELIVPAFLEWLLNQPPAQAFFDRKARGTSLRMIPRSCFDEFDVEVPDLKTQRLVVEVDQLASKEKRLSVDLAEKRQKLVGLALEKHIHQHAVNGRK